MALKWRGYPRSNPVRLDLPQVYFVICNKSGFPSPFPLPIFLLTKQTWGKSTVRLTLLASRDKINRAPGDVCYDLLWYSCHSYNKHTLPDKIMITLGTLGPFNNSHDSSSYLTLNWYLFDSLLTEYCLSKENFTFEKESFALRKKVLSWEKSFVLGKKVLSLERKFCLEKESFALRKKVLP